MSNTPPYLAYLNINDAGDELYKNIVNGNYSYALKITKDLANNNDAVIADVAARLTQEENQNLLSYCYLLWNFSDQQNNVKNYMPSHFKLIFNDAKVVLINHQYNLALKLDASTDEDGDRIPWGDSSDKTSLRVVWKVLPIWENNKVYFKLKNEDCNMYLKMGLWPDEIGDRPVYGSNNDNEMRHTWHLVPTVLNGKNLFYIQNRQMSQKLKLAVDRDYMRDRRLWGHNGTISDNVARYLWNIQEYSPDYQYDEL